MAYETNTATDVNDLLNKFAAFCEANGWTRDSLGDESSGRRWHAHRGSVYANFRSLNNETAPSSSLLQDGGLSGLKSLSFNIGTGYSGASAWYAQAGVPANSAGKKRTVGINQVTGACTYHFFAHNGGDQIIAVVEYTSGYYQRFYFGTLAKYGTFTGGEYFGGSFNGISTDVSSPSFGFFRGSHGSGEAAQMGNVYALVKVDVDAETGWHFNPIANYGAARRTIRDLGNIWSFTAENANQPNTTNDLAVMFPVIAYVDRSTTDTQTQTTTPIGELPNVLYLTLATLVPGQQITLGSTNYRVFPFWKKNTIKALPANGTASTGHSGWYGFAVAE